MSLTYRSPFRNRVYQRKFDHEQAKRRYAAGERIADLAREYGVSPAAVVFAVDARAAARNRNAVAEYHRRGNPSQYWACPECGARARKGHHCRACFDASRCGDAVNERGELLCLRCREYKPVSEFSFRAESARRGFRIPRCRACETRARQNYRERHKVPCAICGAPALPPNEKRPNGTDYPRCRPCFYAGRIPVAA